VGGEGQWPAWHDPPGSLHAPRLGLELSTLARRHGCDPGCWSQDATEPEALENIQDAIRGYLAARDVLLEGAVVREIEIAS
jgi:hypothetical protein